MHSKLTINYYLHLITLVLLLLSCKGRVNQGPVLPVSTQFIIVLGIMQDGGYPQAGCEKACCKAYYDGVAEKELVSCLGLVDQDSGKYWLVDATPDIGAQIHLMKGLLPAVSVPAGIFLTHAHIGHYAGLMQLGREAMGTRDLPVWTMPRMDSFLYNNGPWSQLVSLHNISIQHLVADSSIIPVTGLSISPIQVPHRDEYSETVGFIITGLHKKMLYIPDINKWEQWGRNIVEEIKKVDFALIDGTFYQDGELPGRDMKTIPHPFVKETMKLCADLPAAEKAKVFFIHFNHTNPLIRKESPESIELEKKGFHAATAGMVFNL